MGNHPELDYREGQRPLVHLQADMKATINWANESSVRWAFSDRNAGTYIAEFYSSQDDLGKVNWDAVRATDFRDMEIKEDKQAEFLVYESFPWSLVEKIGTLDSETARGVKDALASANHHPPVSVERSWYY